MLRGHELGEPVTFAVGRGIHEGSLRERARRVNDPGRKNPRVSCRFRRRPFDVITKEEKSSPKEAAMQKIQTFLWFDDQAEEAAEFYCSLFEDSKITNVTRYSDVPGPEGKTLTVNFQLAGQEYVALNGGPEFPFTEAISLLVNCETQNEVDYLWSKLTENGGQEGPCGWLKDRYGLSWQIVPTVLGEMLSGPDAEAAQRVTKAFMQMHKLDIAELEKAYKG
jgi:predicted 3-demethylubiquinone-9 3-methyltransferase (glyoxalase superfamily)